MRIYITRMSLLKKNDDKKIYVKAYALISLLKKQMHEIIYVNDNKFKDYDEIYNLISSCKCLLAFIDTYTLSSTWRMSEITYAMAGMGAFEKVNFHIPVFLYKITDYYNSMFLESTLQQPDVFLLPEDINLAAQTINMVMSE